MALTRQGLAAARAEAGGTHVSNTGEAGTAPAENRPALAAGLGPHGIVQMRDDRIFQNGLIFAKVCP